MTNNKQMSNSKRLILTFDAFGTLFTPREPIGKSYARIARKHGLGGFTDDQIESSFRDGTELHNWHWSFEENFPVG